MNTEEWNKLVQYNKIRKRDYCTFCNKFIYCRHRCKTQERADICPRLHPKPKPPPKIPKTLCDYCNEYFSNPQSLGGHMVSCKLNPKAEERKKRISETKKGHNHSEDTKNKIRNSVNKTNLIKEEGEYESVKTLKTKEEIKLKFFK
jgi:hypothetical protein